MKWSSQSDLDKFAPVTSGIDPGHEPLPPKSKFNRHERTDRIGILYLTQLSLIWYLSTQGTYGLIAMIAVFGIWLGLIVRAVSIEDRENRVLKEMGGF